MLYLYAMIINYKLYFKMKQQIQLVKLKEDLNKAMMDKKLVRVIITFYIFYYQTSWIREVNIFLSKASY